MTLLGHLIFRLTCKAFWICLQSVPIEKDPFSSACSAFWSRECINMQRGQRIYSEDFHYGSFSSLLWISGSSVQGVQERPLFIVARKNIYKKEAGEFGKSWGVFYSCRWSIGSWQLCGTTSSKGLLTSLLKYRATQKTFLQLNPNLGFQYHWGGGCHAVG